MDARDEAVPGVVLTLLGASIAEEGAVRRVGVMETRWHEGGHHRVELTAPEEIDQTCTVRGVPDVVADGNSAEAVDDRVRAGERADLPVGVVDAHAGLAEDRPGPGVAAVRPAGQADPGALEVGRGLGVRVAADDDAAVPEPAHQEHRQRDDAIVAGRSGPDVPAERGLAAVVLRRRPEIGGRLQPGHGRTRDVAEGQRDHVVPVANAEFKLHAVLPPMAMLVRYLRYPGRSRGVRGRDGDVASRYGR
jgi:hypothetical protein